MVREEIKNLLDWYFQETGRVLPESWSFWGFCNQLLDFESTTEIKTNWFSFFCTVREAHFGKRKP